MHTFAELKHFFQSTEILRKDMCTYTMKNQTPKHSRLPMPGIFAVRILLCELPFILLYAVAFLIHFLTDYRIDPLGSAYRYSELLEYITVPLLICLATALIADLLERERDMKK